MNDDFVTIYQRNQHCPSKLFFLLYGSTIVMGGELLHIWHRFKNGQFTSTTRFNATTTIFIWEKATRLPERAQPHQSWPPKKSSKENAIHAQKNVQNRNMLSIST